MRTRTRLLAATYLTAAVGMVAGCNSKAPAPAPAPAPEAVAVGGDPVPATGGEGVFSQHCQKCHVGGKAPDLSHVGASHDAAWIAEHTRDPKAHKPMSRMPAFAGKLTDKEMQEVSEHLAAKK